MISKYNECSLWNINLYLAVDSGHFLKLNDLEHVTSLHKYLISYNTLYKACRCLIKDAAMCTNNLSKKKTIKGKALLMENIVILP